MTEHSHFHERQQSPEDLPESHNPIEPRQSAMGVEIAGRNWLVDMTDIIQVLPLPKYTTVPFTKPWFCGVANVRGNLYNVIDLAAYLHSLGFDQPGTCRASGDAHNRVLLLAERYDFNVALLVERIWGLRDIQGWRRESADGQMRYVDESEATWTMLNVATLLEQSEFLQIGDTGITGEEA